MDGEITIGTNLSTDKFDRQIAKFEKDMQKEEEKLELKLQAKEMAEDKLNKHKQEIQSLQQQYDKLKDSAMKYEEALAKIQAGQSLTPAEYKAYDNNKLLAQDYYNLGEQIQKAKDKQSSLELTAQRTSKAYDDVVNKVNEYKSKIENVKIQKQVADVERLKNSFNTVGSSIQKSITNVARLALGIFGLRSAYMALRRASSDLASYDQQYATNLEYIRYALTQAIAPVLRYIVSLAATLLGYINAIVQAWFGINLFSKGSAKNFQKMKAGASGASKAVKEIKKQLAGFDEMNVLTNQSDSGAGGGGGAMPDFDLSKMQGEPPAWLQWIIDHKAEILSVLAGIATALTLIHFGISAIKAIGIGAMVAGLLWTIVSLKDYLEAPTWENFGKIIQGIGIFLAGLLGIILGFPGVVAGVVVFIVGTIIKHWEQIKAFLQGGIDWLKGKSDWVHYMFGDTIGSIYDYFVSRFQAILNFANGFFNSIKQVFDGFITFLKGVFTRNWQEAFEGLKQIASGVINNILNIFNYVLSFLQDRITFWGTVVGNAFGGAFKTVVNAVLRTIESVLNTPIRAINGLISAVNSIPGITLPHLSTFNLPRLKAGGIINMPNKGTMLGSAIGGESGKEGVLPLTDTQAMAELGREIGRWININATVPIYVGNRQIAREVRRINAEDDFAYNL